MSRNEELKLEFKVVITLICLACSVVAAHFAGVASAKSDAKAYTDQQIEMTNKKMAEFKADLVNEVRAMSSDIRKIDITLASIEEKIK